MLFLRRSKSFFFSIVSITENLYEEDKRHRVEEKGKAMWKMLSVELGKCTLCLVLMDAHCELANLPGSHEEEN